MNNFFWGNGKDNGDGIRWFRWKRLAVPKVAGGLGYWELRQFNLALVAKQGWRLLKYPNTLASKVLKAKYFSHSDFFQAPVGNGPSQIWRSDPYIRTEVAENMPFVRVSDLILNRTWNAELIQTHFQQHDSDNILHIPLSLRECDDDWCWALNRKGEYVVKEGYRVAMEDNLADLSVGLEKDFHVLYCCSFARSYWLLSNLGWVSFSSLNTMLSYVLTFLHVSQREEVFMLIWSLWIHRNDVVWNQIFQQPIYVVNRARVVLEEWQLAWLHFRVTDSGMVVRNSLGYCCECQIMIVSGLMDPLLGELKSKNYFPVCMETDCELVVNALNSSHSDSLYFKLIINDCKALLHELQYISFAFVRRSANQVAHTVARRAGSMSDFDWGMPSFILIQRIII
ncbi:hypothetical protein MANES_09G042601v8 [Manihot esculenta]|uniref:Uncharacterized protein n=1 Tax=Manihot esculenta TaxID=3983 RepID=A0ACB7H383_MANES|nr:hypothetical protein MANES_09G042601v8 [Manihot esculenta]